MPPYGYPGPVLPNQQPRMRRVRRRQRKFRWYLLWIPLVLLAWGWLGRGLEPALSWDEAMDALGVRDRMRVTQLATLGVIVTGVIAIVTVVRRGKDDDWA